GPRSTRQAATSPVANISWEIPRSWVRCPSSHGAVARCGKSEMRASIQMTSDAVSRRRLLDGRRLGGATGHGKRTARVETAAGRRRQGARHLALDRDALALVVGMRRQGGGKQRLGIGMQRLVAQLERVG